MIRKISTQTISLLYLRFSGAKLDFLENFKEYHFSKGFLALALFSILISLVLLGVVIAYLFIYGIYFLLNVRAIISIIGAPLLLSAFSSIVCERISQIAEGLAKYCDRITFTSRGAMAHFKSGGFIDVKLIGQYTKVCKISLLIPKELPMNFTISPEDLSKFDELKPNSLTRNIIQLINIGMKEIKIKACEAFEPFEKQRIRGLLISLELASMKIGDALNLLFNFLEKARGAELADFALLLIRLKVKEVDVSAMYKELISYHKKYFGDKAKEVVDKILTRISEAEKIEPKVAIVKAWKSYIRSEE